MGSENRQNIVFEGYVWFQNNVNGVFFKNQDHLKTYYNGISGTQIKMFSVMGDCVCTGDDFPKVSLISKSRFIIKMCIKCMKL